MSPRRHPLRRTVRVLLWVYVPALVAGFSALVIAAWGQGLPK